MPPSSALKPYNMRDWLTKFLSGDPTTLRRVRGWSLMMLYLTLGAWSLLFTYATYHFWPSEGGIWIFSINHLGLAILSLIGAFFCIRTTVIYWTTYQASGKFPETAFVPFLAVMATIVVAGQTLTV